MSIQSRLRSHKWPTGNSRLETKRALATLPAKVTDSGTGKTTLKTIPFNAEPGHRPLALIPPPRRGGYRLYPEQPVAKGAFGGVSKAERRRRFEARKRNLAKKA